MNAVNSGKATLLIKNARIVDVFTEKVLDGDIAIYDDTILGFGKNLREKYKAKNEIDVNGKYVSPGFIDSHLHIESSMTTPRGYASVVVPHGTTSIIADPHEIANVLGTEGISFLLDQSENAFLHIYIMMPSCVPCSSFEHSGCTLLAKDMEKLSKNKRIIGLGEVMDYVSLTTADEDMMNKIDLFKDKIIDGHAPGLFNETLDAYAIGGPFTDHECATFDELTDRLSRGMKVLIRMGSAANDVEDMFKKIAETNLPTENLLLCTDDKHLEDLKNEGHINYILKTAVKCGIAPIKAIKMATINAATTYRLEKTGAIAPGYKADLVFLDDLESFNVNSVIIDGKAIPKDFKLPKVPYKQNVTGAVNIPNLTEKSFELPVNGKMPVINIVPGQILTKKTMEDLSQENGAFKPQNDYLKIAVIERHHALGNIGLGVVKGFGLNHGALASTVAHDSHNLMIIGDNDSDMLFAAETLKECGGGFALVQDGKVMGLLKLPIAGLMSDEEPEDIIKNQKQLLNSAWEMGVSKEIDPFITLSFLGLPVIPEIRITDMGVFDVKTFAFI